MSGKREDRPESAESFIVRALNEHGFLYQLASTLDAVAPDELGSKIHGWEIEAVEFPVSVSETQHTRVDLILKNAGIHNWNVHLVIETKRANPDFKSWVFFGQDYGLKTDWRNHVFIEHIRSLDRSNSDPVLLNTQHAVPSGGGFRLMAYYLEARDENPRSKSKRFSHTDSIENAFRQVTLGLAGVSKRLRWAETPAFTLLPVVVTTANLCAARIPIGKIDSARGTIADDQIRVEEVPWLAVNYRLDDTISAFLSVRYAEQKSIADALLADAIRTVFVVQSKSLPSFLEEIEQRVAGWLR